jgi:alkylation response protein AidB-like acyl-CoA dehydrogenase
VDLLPSPDQLELTGATAAFCAQVDPTQLIRRRRYERTALPAENWSAAAELGLLGLSAPPSVGGLDMCLADEALVFRELGRALMPGPFLPTVLAARVATLGGDAELATQLVSGEVLCGLAIASAARLSPDRMSGRVHLVDAVGADYVVVVDPAGAGLLSTASSDRFDWSPVDCLDPGSRLAVGDVNGAELRCFVPTERDPIWLRGLVLAAAMHVGIAEACRDLSVDHAKNRIQFGRPIGVNQAVKHRCADMAVAAEAALQQMVYAALSLQDGNSDAGLHALAARIVASKAALSNASEALQVHGGMGFTFEHDVHLYLKRAHILDHLFGSRASHLDELLLLGAAS